MTRTAYDYRYRIVDVDGVCWDATDSHEDARSLLLALERREPEEAPFAIVDAHQEQRTLLPAPERKTDELADAIAAADNRARIDQEDWEESR